MAKADYVLLFDPLAEASGNSARAIQFGNVAFELPPALAGDTSW